MENEIISQVAQAWDEKTYDIMNLKENSTSEMEELLKNTYHVLYEYHIEKNIPKDVCWMLLNMDEYMYFLSMIGSNEEALTKSQCMYQALYCIIDAMKKGFFNGKYVVSFPMLQVNINGIIFEINMEEAFLEELLDS